MREQEKKSYKISWILAGILVALWSFVAADQAGAGVVIKNQATGRMGNIDVAIHGCMIFSIFPPDCRILPNVESFKNLFGLGAISTQISWTTNEGDKASANAFLSMGPVTDGVQITGSFSGSVNAIERKEGFFDVRLGTLGGVGGIPTLIMDIAKSTRVTIEIIEQISLERTGRVDFIGTGVSASTFSKDGKFTIIISDSFACPSSQLSCHRNITLKSAPLEVTPGQQIFIGASSRGVIFPPLISGNEAYLGNITYTVRVIEEGACQGLTLDVTPTEVWPIKTGASNVNTANISAKISDPAPPGGCVVSFDVEPVSSKGHLHGVHPKDKAGKVAVSGNTTPSCTIPKGSTKCDSMVTYKAPEIAGEEKITATLADRGEKAEKTIRIRVPGLNTLPSGTGYRLTGSFGDLGVSSQHTENHFGTEPAKARIIMLSLDYLNSKKATLGINDMSLPWGGLFDVGNNWSSNPGHGQHRVGKSMDIDRNALGTDGKPKKVDQRWLNSAAKEKWQLTRIPEPPRVNCPDCIHYESPD